MQTLKDEQRKNLRVWVEALRSGKYQQGIGALVRNREYCCLGVACEAMELKPADSDNGPIGFYFDSGLHCILPNDGWMRETFGFDILKQFNGARLQIHNDSLGASFETIAKYIEDELLSI